jgi:nitrous-oxide reductase
VRLGLGEGVVDELHLVAGDVDELHGFGLLDYNINLVIDPGETKTVTFTAKKSGVFAFYCTNFCSALHQEMQGYMVVK